MGFVLEIGVQFRKSMRTCYRSLCHHPVLAAFLLFLTFLHRFFPFAFSLLVTASPVLVCSVILLGTLLIFGQPDLAKTEGETKIAHDFASVRTRVSVDETVSFERDGKFSIEKFSGKSVDELSCSRYSSDPEGSVGYVPLIDETFHYTDNERRELDGKELENQRVIHKEKLGIDSIDGIRRNVKAVAKPASLKGDHSESSQGGDGGDDEATDSGSDRAESSSPDASIADILPILDELHPLLDVDAPLPVHMSPDDSGLESDRSNDGSNESDDEDTEIRSTRVQEYGVDDNDGDDEEEAHEGKEDESKSAIKWTEDDQMNLRDLGNLELERNRCLDKVLTMRRALKVDEKNLIDLDSSESPFNIPQIVTTRHNPFDLSHDSYDGRGLSPIPGSAPSSYLPRRNPFDLLYEANEESSELSGDHAEEHATFLPTNTIFCRHQSFRPSRFGDTKQEKRDHSWKPIFVPEQLASEGTNYCSFQGLPRDASDSKLSSIPDTETVSSGEDLDEMKLSQRVNEAEVISNIYQASHLVNHRSHSSEDLDPLEMERPGEKDIQHDESEIKLGEVKDENASLSGTGRLVIPVEPITKSTYLTPEAFEDKNSNRSSSSLSSEVDENSSELRKDGSKSFEPFVMEVQTMSGMVDDLQHKEPVYDTSPPGSAKVLFFDSISSDIQAEASEIVPEPSSVEMCVPSVDQALDSDLHGDSIEKGTSENGRGSGECNQLFLTSHSDVHDDLPKNLNVKAALPNCSAQFVSSKDNTPAEEKNLLRSSMSTDQSSFDDHNALPEPHILLLELKEESSSRDVDAVGVQDPSLKKLLPVSAKSTSSNKAPGVQETIGTDTAMEQTSEANKLPKPSNSKDGSVGIEANALDSTEETASNNTDTSIEETVTNISPKKLSEANGEQTQPSNSNDRSSKVETSSKDSTKVNASSNTEAGVKEPAATPDSLKKVLGDIDPQLPTSSNSKDGSTVVGTKTNSPKKGSEANDGELPKSSILKDGSTGIGTNAMGSTKEIASVDISTAVQETVTTRSTPKEDSEDNSGELTELSNIKDGSTDVNNTVGSTKDIALTSTTSGVQETVKAPVKQISESDVSKLPKSSEDIALSNTGYGVQETATTMKQVPKSDDIELPKPFKDEFEKVETNDAVNSTTSLQETAPTLPKEVSEGNLSESSKSKDGMNEVESNVVSSAKEISSNSLGTGLQDSVSTRTPAKKLSEANVGDLPKSSDSKDGHKEIETNAVSSTTEIAPQKQVSEGNHSEATKLSNSSGGSTEVGTNAAGSSQSVQETATNLKQVSQGDANELPKPSNTKDRSPEVMNAVDSTESVQDSNQEPETKVSVLPKPSNSKHGSTEVRTDAVDSTKTLSSGNTEGITAHSVKQVPEDNLSELPKSHANDGSAEIGTNALDPIISLQQTVSANINQLPEPSDVKDGSTIVPTTVNSTKSVQETITKQVSEGKGNELPKPFKDGSTKVGTDADDSTEKLAPGNMETGVQVGVDAVGSIKDIPSSKTESGFQKRITTSESDVAELPRSSQSDGHLGEGLKPSIPEESNAGKLPKPTNTKESNATESQKPADPEENNAGESQKPSESKGWLWW
ncbi:uncharacterized protein LOC126783288 [Argentina anserina]|uniref:uncharacterized protein LOC126783288 n=1 Tax=Argentina anserina TaxID=57926 RepID=UPI0021768818|nr:uncharacterized protein LOC126783288 [Potentilla anserina]